MKMLSKKRALDKIYKRRDRYEIPEWQRGEVWDTRKKQELIDSILRGWKLPKFYFVRTEEDPESFEVVDGQQRLAAVFDFFDNTLPLSAQSAKAFRGKNYKDLPSLVSDDFDDFEIEYDEIIDADEPELKAFFQRLQQGLPLTSSEKLNAVHSNLRDFCRELARHEFFQTSVSFSDKRYAYFDVAAKTTAIEIEGLDAGLRFDDMKMLFENQSTFSRKSAAARRLIATLDYLVRVFPTKSPELRNRSVVQSVITLTSRIVAAGNAAGQERELQSFISNFMSALARQVELGLNAKDAELVAFQRSVNANVRQGAKTRHEILLRRLFRSRPAWVDVFAPGAIAESGAAADLARLGTSIEELISQANAKYSARHGEDLFKPTNKTVSSFRKMKKPIRDFAGYKEFVTDLYFIFRESLGHRLESAMPPSFKDVSDLRTDLQHDVDHGARGKISAKRKKLSASFAKYASTTTPATMDPERFVVLQSNLMANLEGDLTRLLAGL